MSYHLAVYIAEHLEKLGSFPAKRSIDSIVYLGRSYKLTTTPKLLES